MNIRKHNFFDFDEFFSDFDEVFNLFGNEEKSSSDITKDPDMDYEKEEGEKDGRKWVKETWKGDNSYVVKTHIKKSSIDSEKESVKDLESDMEKAIKEERFEDAATLRDKIKSIKNK